MQGSATAFGKQRGVRKPSNGKNLMAQEPLFIFIMQMAEDAGQQLLRNFWQQRVAVSLRDVIGGFRTAPQSLR